MKLLLDSCTLIWLASEPGNLSAAAAEGINDPASMLHVSHASLWEVTLKHSSGKLALPDPPRHCGQSRCAGGHWWSFVSQRKYYSGPVNCLLFTRIRLIASSSRTLAPGTSTSFLRTDSFPRTAFRCFGSGSAGQLRTAPGQSWFSVVAIGRVSRSTFASYSQPRG